MVQLNGKYELVENHNFKEVLIRAGVPEDRAQLANDAKTVAEVIVDGKKIKLQSDEKLGTRATEVILDEEVEEKFPTGTVKSIAKLNGNVLTIESKGQDGNSAGKRTFTFTDSGMEMVYTAAGDDLTARRVYKRL